jgi:hypothetical protein
MIFKRTKFKQQNLIEIFQKLIALIIVISIIIPPIIIVVELLSK